MKKEVGLPLLHSSFLFPTFPVLANGSLSPNQSGAHFPSSFKPHPYSDIPGVCKSATTAEIAAHGHVLTPGRYVGAKEVEDDGDPFEEKMPRLVAELQAQFSESAKLESAIRQNLKGLGYAF